MSLSLDQDAPLQGSALPQATQHRTLLWVVLGVALLVRLAAAAVLPGEFGLRSDAEQYLAVADNLLTNGVFGQFPGVPYATIPPGYPLLIAGVFALSGHSLLALRVVQALLGTIIVWLVYLIGKENFSGQGGLAAALVMALYPPWIFYAAIYGTETLYTLFALAFFLYLLRTLRTPSTRNILSMGVWFALALLTRETLIMLPLLFPLFAWWAKISARQWLRHGVLFVLTLLVVLSPWLARNWSTFGYPFYTTRTDAVLYRFLGMGFHSTNVGQAVAESEAQHRDPERHREYFERFGYNENMLRLSFMLEQPGTYARYLLYRLTEFWLHPNGVESLPDSLPVRVIYYAGTWLLLGLALWQMIVRVRRREVAAMALVAVLLYVTMVIIFLRRPLPRYNVPFLPLVFLFTGSALWQLVRHSRLAERLLPSAKFR